MHTIATPSLSLQTRMDGSTIACAQRYLRPRSDAPNKWSIFSIVNKSSYLHISMTKGVQRKNSSDLSFGRRPVSKSEEFFLWTTLVIEIQPPQPFLLLPKRCTLYRSITPRKTKQSVTRRWTMSRPAATRRTRLCLRHVGSPLLRRALRRGRKILHAGVGCSTGRSCTRRSQQLSLIHI